MCLLAVPFTPISGLLHAWPFGAALCHLVPSVGSSTPGRSEPPSVISSHLWAPPRLAVRSRPLSSRPVSGLLHAWPFGAALCHLVPALGSSTPGRSEPPSVISSHLWAPSRLAVRSRLLSSRPISGLLHAWPFGAALCHLVPSLGSFTPGRSEPPSVILSQLWAPPRLAVRSRPLSSRPDGARS